METVLIPVPRDTGTFAATFAAMRTSIAESQDPEWIKTVRDHSAAFLAAFRRTLNRSEEAREREYAVAEVKLRAERRLGKMLSTVDFHKGGRPPKQKTDNSRLL